jgi:protease-4
MDSYQQPPNVPPPLRPPLRSPVVRRSATGWKIAVAILGLLLFISLFAHLTSLLHGFLPTPTGSHYRSGKTLLEEVVVKDNDSRHKIAVLPIEGLIMDQGLGSSHPGLVRLVRDQLEAAGEDPRVRAVILKVDSPGGEVLASDEINRAIDQFQKDHGKPVIASMGSLAASGGYYVSASSRWIVAHELTITGSIGVIMQTYNYRGLMDKIGLRPEVFKSGKFKDMLSPDKKESEITAEERAMIQRMVDETFQRFKDVVARGRNQSLQKNQSSADDKDKGRPLADNWQDYADGRILSGREAYERGFVDELGNMEAAVDRALKLAGIGSANLVQYRQVFDLGSFLRLFGRAEGSRTIQVDLGLEPPHLPAGQLYFLSPTYLR